MRLIRGTLAILATTLTITAASAQSGGLQIVVVDDEGPLPRATVTLEHETGFVGITSELTDDRGTVSFPVLRPGKGYSVEVSFPGFGKRLLSDLHVRINSTQKLIVHLAAEHVETVRSIGEPDVVDLEDPSISSKFTDEFMDDLPVAGRSYLNVLTKTPGVQDSNDDGNPNVHGSRDRDFKTLVSGISNVDPLTGQFASQVNPNSIEELEVVTAGAGVEFGGAQGGIALILQKQGSNEFEGVLEYYFRSSRLDGDGAFDGSNLPDQKFEWNQPSVQVSGPIIKSKVWYVLSHELIDQQRPVNVVTGLAVTTVKQTINSDRFTWQVSPRNKLSFHFQSDPLEIDNFGVSSQTPPESSQRREFKGETYSLTWTAPYSPKLLVESQVAWQDFELGIFPSTVGVKNSCVEGDAFLENAQCLNVETNQVSGSYFRTVDDHRQRLTFKTDATIFGGRIWGMNHQFKLGFIVENERYFRRLEEAPDLNVFIIDATDTADPGAEGPELLAIIDARISVPQRSNARATGVAWGVYAADRIKPRQNLTIELGVRVEREETDSNGLTPFDPEAESDRFLELVDDVGIAQAAPQSFTAFEDLRDFTVELASTLGVSPDSITQQLSSIARQSQFWQQTRREGNITLTNTNVSPFLSIAWDPWGDGKTKIAMTGGRHFGNLFLGIPLIELEPIATDLLFNAEVRPNGQFAISGLRNSVNPAVNISAVDRNLETPYQDELLFVFERELWAETSLKLSYINRKFRNQLQDIDLNHVPGDLGRCRVATLANTSTVVEVLPGDSDYDPALAPGDGIIDDCSGELFIPEGQNIDETDPTSSEGRLERPDGVPDLYLQNPGWGDVFLVGNFNESDYEAYVLELVRRQYRSWEMQASYTWSESKGNGEDFQQELGDDRSLLQDEVGYQSQDQRHVVKVNATTITPWGFRLGGSVSWESGLPYSLITRKLAFDTVPPSYRSIGSGNPARRREQYATGRRNDQRNRSFWNVDAKLTKEINLGRGLNLQFSAEVFNLLNDGTYEVFDPLRDSGRQINGNNIARRRFGRQWQIGVKIAF